MTESMLVNQVIRVLYPFADLTRVNTGTVKTAAGYSFSTGTPKGYSDISGNLRSNRSRSGFAVAVYIECKVGNGKPTPEQVEFIQKKMGQGCIAGIVYNTDQAMELLRPHVR